MRGKFDTAGKAITLRGDRFNEARAFCAGNCRRDRTSPPPGKCFNEARAFCAGNSLAALWRPVDPCAASMRPARFAREIFRTHPNQIHTRYASMRPARFAREILQSVIGFIVLLLRFNEARAFCAGNSQEGHRWPTDRRGFNEARAFCAGNWQSLYAGTT